MKRLVFKVREQRLATQKGLVQRPGFLVKLTRRIFCDASAGPTKNSAVAAERSRCGCGGGDGRRKGVRRGRDFTGGFREGAARGYRRREGRQEAQRKELWGADGAFQCGVGWWKGPDWVQSRRYALSLIGMMRELVGRVHVRRGAISNSEEREAPKMRRVRRPVDAN